MHPGRSDEGATREAPMWIWTLMPAAHAGFTDTSVAAGIGNDDDKDGGSVFVDFDHDGDLDLITVGHYDDEILVALNEGDGTFTIDGTYAVGATPEWVELADLDGDGAVDVVWTLRQMHIEAEDVLWFQLDVLGTPRTHLVAGLEGYSAADIDQDGNDELLVGDADGAVWVLGAGSDELPPWQPVAVEQEDLGPPPSDDPAVRRAWTRANDLADVGLVAEAATALMFDKREGR